MRRFFFAQNDDVKGSSAPLMLLLTQDSTDGASDGFGDDTKDYVRGQFAGALANGRLAGVSR